MSRFDYGKPPGFEHKGKGALAQYREIVRKLAVEHNVDLLDLPYTVQKLKLDANEQLIDEIHPTEKGHAFIAGEVAKLLRKHL